MADMHERSEYRQPGRAADRSAELRRLWVGIAFVIMAIVVFLLQYFSLQQVRLPIDIAAEEIRASALKHKSTIPAGCHLAEGVVIGNEYATSKESALTTTAEKFNGDCRFPYKMGWQLAADVFGLMVVPLLSAAVMVLCSENQRRRVVTFGSLVLALAALCMCSQDTSSDLSYIYGTSQHETNPTTWRDLLYPLALSGVVTAMLSAATYVRDWVLRES